MILTISPRSLEALQECAKKYQYQKLRKLSPIQTEESKDGPMERGSLFHMMLAAHYDMIKDGKQLNAIIESVGELAREQFREGPFNDIEMVESCITNYTDYAQYYANDGWNPIATETPFSKVLYQDDNHTIVLEGVIDLIVKNSQGIEMPIDHKTSTRRDNFPTPLNNQFTCYSWVTGSSIFIKNDVGFQKTLSPGERFSRKVLNYTDEAIAEWVSETTYHCLSLIKMIENDYFPMSLSACSRCSFRKICESMPDAREHTIESRYKIGEDFDIYTK